jgi:hypothetical protein
MNTATRQLSASLDIWYLENEKNDEKKSEKKNEKIEKIRGDSVNVSLLKSNQKMRNDSSHSNYKKSDNKKPLFFFIHGGGWKNRAICIYMYLYAYICNLNILMYMMYTYFIFVIFICLQIC